MRRRRCVVTCAQRFHPPRAALTPGQTHSVPAGAGAALEGDYSPLRARFEQALAQALQGDEEQEYLEQHPVLARVPAHHRLYIICRQSPGHTKSYNFWVQHREVLPSLCCTHKLYNYVCALVLLLHASA